MPCLPRFSSFCYLLALAVCASTEAQEWTRFRGPNGSGRGQMMSPPLKFGEADYKWKVELPGVGHSSPVLWGDAIFLTSGDDTSGARIVLCLDASTGQTRWRRDYEEPHHRKHKLNSFASPTPAVDKRRVYIAWGTPERILLLALDHAGEEQWRADLGPFKSGHGFGVSPIVHDELVILPVEHQGDSALVALDSATGKERWRVPRESKTVYSTPCVLQRPGRPAELVFTSWEYGITAVDAASGKTTWEIDVFDKRHIETSIGSPVLAGDLVVGMSGWLGYGKQVIAVRAAEKNGDLEPQEAYRIERSAPLCTTPLVSGRLLFLWADEGIVTCADAQSGKVHWRQRVGGTYYSSPIAVGDYLYNISADGEVVVLAAQEEFEVLARHSLGESSHATPAVAGGVMYLRTFSRLYAFDGR